MRFISTLHCETAWNLEGRLQGQIDTDLHDIGIAHAHKKSLAFQQGQWHIARIVSSDLKRTIQTAQIINTYLNVPHEIDARLRECCYGSLQGLSKSELTVKYPTWNDSFLSYDYRSVGGECREDVIKRQHEVLIDLQHVYHSEDILIVGHGTSMNTLFSALGMPNLPIRRDEIRVLTYEK